MMSLKTASRIYQVSEIRRKINKAATTGLSKLSKPIKKGENTFPFEYEILCVLKLELTPLKQILEILIYHKKSLVLIFCHKVG